MDLIPCSLIPFDLEPPSPLRGAGDLFAHPRYVPTPLATGNARVTLDEDYYLGPRFSIYVDGSSHRPDEVFDIPREQYERWEATQAAYYAMQEEIGALIEARRRESRG